jgi:hypothetical protein
MLSETEMLSLHNIMNQIHEKKHKPKCQIAEQQQPNFFTVLDGKMLKQNIGLILQKLRDRHIHFSAYY